MKHNDEFVPESVEEQIDQISYSPDQEHLSPSIQVIRGLYAYYKEDQQSTERIWERLTPYLAEKENVMLSTPQQRNVVNEISNTRILTKKSEQRAIKSKTASPLAMIAAVLCTALIVGSLLFVLQMVHSTHTGSIPSLSAQSRSLYINKKGVVSRLDLTTHKTVWTTAVSKSALNFSVMVVLSNTVYLTLSNQLYALNTSDGSIRWSKKNLSVFPLVLDDGLVYAKGTLAAKSALYALDPADGKIKATYTPHYGKELNMPGVADGILYYSSGTDIYAISTTDQHLIWHQSLSSLDPTIEGPDIIINSGIVYVQGSFVPASIGHSTFLTAYDARTGKQLWTPKIDTQYLTIADATIYTTTISSTLSASMQIYAYDGNTGKQLWHQSINPAKIQNNSGWHSIIKTVVDSNVLYVSYDSNSSIKGLVALEIRDGKPLWQTTVNNQEANSPLGIQDKAVYTISNNGKNGSIDAFNISDGSQAWHLPLNGNAVEWQAIIA